MTPIEWARRIAKHDNQTWSKVCSTEHPCSTCTMIADGIAAAVREALASLTCEVDHSFGRNGGKCCLVEQDAIAALRGGTE